MYKIKPTHTHANMQRSKQIKQIFGLLKSKQSKQFDNDLRNEF